MKTFVQQSKSMTTYDAPAPYGKRQLTLRAFIETETEMLEQFKRRLDDSEGLSFSDELERRTEFLKSLLLLEQELWGR